MNLTEQDFQEAASTLNCDVASIKAVCEIEAPRGGFNPDGTPVTLFEGHKFHKYTGGIYSISNPDLSYPNWTKIHYGKTWQQEQSRLNRAKVLDLEAAFKSASWGKFQIMGFNHEAAGFETVRMFVNAMYIGEKAQLMAFVNFVRNDVNLLMSLRSRDWAKFARGYNGAAYAVNSYDVKLAAAYAKYAGRAIEIVTETVVEAIEATPVKAAPTILTIIMAIFKAILSAFKK